MKIRLRSIVFFFFAASVFLFAFEQATNIFLGLDTELKPYRLTILLAISLLPFRRIKLGRQTQHVLFVFLAIFSAGILLGLFRSIFFSTSISPTLHQAQLFIFAFCFFVLAVSSIERPQQITRLALVILLAAVFSSGIVFLSGYGFSWYRFSGFFRNPNHYAFMLCLSLLISFYFITRSIGKPLIVVLLLTWFFTGVLLLILSGSRGALGTAALAMILFLLRYLSLPGRGRSSRVLIGLGLVILFVVALPYVLSADLISSRIIDRFTAEQIQTGSGRFDIWRAGLLAAEDAYFGGIGMGQYTSVHHYYIRQVDGDVYQTALDWDLGLHSEYVNLLVEFGILSLFAYLFAIFWVWRGIRRFGTVFPEWKHLSGLLEALLVFNLLFSATQTSYIFPYNWMILGICASLIRIRHIHTNEQLRSSDVLA